MAKATAVVPDVEILKTYSPASLMLPALTWGIVALGWAAASMAMTGAGSRGVRVPLAWQRLLVLFGPLFLLGHLPVAYVADCRIA